MTTYNTGNPIGSTDARDRLDNSENLDLAVNSLSQTFVDRLGRTRDTLEGVYQKSAYYRAGTFDDGYTLTNNRQTLAYGNVEYSWSGVFPKIVPAGSTPTTSGGVGAGAWVDRTNVTLRSQLLSDTGSELVSHKRTGTSNSVALSLRGVLDGVFCNLAVEYGIDRTGTTDVTTLLQTAINEVSALGIKGYLPAGKYKITPNNGATLSTITYAYGDATLKAGLVIPYGWDLVTDGTSTQLCMYGLTSTSVGVAIGEDGVTGVGFSQKSHCQDGFMIRAMSSVGRYGVLTPKNTDLFTRKRPKYQFRSYIHFCGATDDRTVLRIPDEGWDVGFLLGDCFRYDATIIAHGTFNPSISPSGQHQMTGFKCSSARGAVNICLKMWGSAMFKGIELAEGVEGFSITDSEIAGVYYGIIAKSSDTDPGGFIDCVHVNAVKECYRFEQRSLIHLGSVEAYRADGFYTDGATPWFGIRVMDSSELNIDYLTVACGDTFAGETLCAGVHSDVTSTFTVGGWRARSVYKMFAIDGSPDCKFGDGSVNQVNRIVALSNGASDISGGEIRVRFSAPEFYFTTDGTIDKGRLSFPQKSLISSEARKEITVSAAGSITVRPRLTPSKYEISLAAGTYAYNIILDHGTAIDGDTVDIKLVTVSNVNAVLNIYTGSTGSLLSTFATASSTRFYLRYEYSATNNLWRELIMTSLDATY